MSTPLILALIALWAAGLGLGYYVAGKGMR